MLSTFLKQLKNNTDTDDQYGELLEAGPELDEIEAEYIPNARDDAQEQLINFKLENELDRGLIQTINNPETQDLKDYIDMVDYVENLKNGNMQNDLDEAYEEYTKHNDIGNNDTNLNQQSLQSYAQTHANNDIGFNFENFYKH